jgi:hypothetical protein
VLGYDVDAPAYSWVWTRFEELSGHYRRYTRRRAVNAVRAAGLTVERATYVFMSVFPIFAADRLRTRQRERTPEKPDSDVATLPQVSPVVERTLMALSRLDQRLLQRRNLPVGSSVVVAASKPGVADGRFSSPARMSRANGVR